MHRIRSSQIRNHKSKIINLLFLLAVTGCSQQILSQPKMPSPEDHWVKTDDNWTLHILRYKPVRLDPKRSPVILCHGLSHNNLFWDVVPKTSLAQYLQAGGFDVWSVSLRGAGQSTKPKLSQLKQLFRLNVSVFNPAGLLNRQPALIRTNWTVDDHIYHDIPAALSYVLKLTGHKQVHWIGHSLGAMIMFGYLATSDQTVINTFVGVSPPMFLIRPANDVFEIMAQQADFVRIGNLAAGTNLRAVFGALAGNLIETPIDLLFLNSSNVEPGLVNVFYYRCEEDISPGQLDQLIRFLKVGHFQSYEGKVDYTEMVDKINVPVLQIVGQLDNMALPGFVAVIHDRLGSKEKKLRIFGKINGYRADYGHDDIIIGKYARLEVFPYIANWLNEHPAKMPTTQPTTKPTSPLIAPLKKLFTPKSQPTTRRAVPLISPLKKLLRPKTQPTSRPAGRLMKPLKKLLDSTEKRS